MGEAIELISILQFFIYALIGLIIVLYITFFFLTSPSKNKENSSNNNSNNLDMEDFLNSRYENDYNNVKKSNYEDDNNDPIRRL